MLIVNADDLGYDPEIDRGILEAHAHGVVSSATAMVDTPFSAEALRRAPRSLGIGLHAVLDLQLGRAEAEREIARQLDRFAELRGALPDHLDSHKHHHAQPALLEAMARSAAARGLPVRALDLRMRKFLRERGVRTTDLFLGDADLRPCWTGLLLAQALESAEADLVLEAAAPGSRAAPAAPRSIEVMCHPGYPPSQARTSFGKEREIELAACLDERVRAVAGRLGLGTFATVQ